MPTILCKFLEYLTTERRYSSYTINSYQLDLMEYFTYLKQNNLDYSKIDYYLFRYYIIDLTSKDYKKSTIKRKLSAISSFYNYLVMNEIASVNPILLNVNIKQDNSLPEFLFVEEVKYLIAQCNEQKFVHRNKLIIKLLFLNGLRVGELVNIKLSDLKQQMILIHGKGNKERYCVLNQDVTHNLATYLAVEHNGIDNLFINANGNALTDRGVRYIIATLAKRSKLNKKVYPHMLRHSFATYFLNHGSDLRTVQNFLGHENLSTTQIYTHLTKQQLVDAHQKFHPRNKGNSCKKK